MSFVIAKDDNDHDDGNDAALKAKWVFTSGDVSATSTVAGDAIYFPDWAGNLYAVNRKTGTLIWSHQISAYDHVPGATACVSPAIHSNDLILGDIQSGNAPHAGAVIDGPSVVGRTVYWAQDKKISPATPNNERYAFEVAGDDITTVATATTAASTEMRLRRGATWFPAQQPRDRRPLPGAATGSGPTPSIPSRDSCWSGR
jgi:outer membrane protein assembly factor BamB